MNKSKVARKSNKTPPHSIQSAINSFLETFFDFSFCPFSAPLIQDKFFDTFR